MTEPAAVDNPLAGRPPQTGEPAAAGGAGPTSRRHQWVALAAFAAPVAGAAVLGGRFSPADPTTGRWYRHLDKAPFQPPDSAFAPAWSALYPTIAVSGWRVWRGPASGARTAALALWAVQLGANAAWSPAFFGARRPRLALGVLATQLGATAAYAAAAARVDRVAAALVGPYLGWTGFAGVLNAEIVRRNPPPSDHRRARGRGPRATCPRRRAGARAAAAVAARAPAWPKVRR